MKPEQIAGLIISCTKKIAPELETRAIGAQDSFEGLGLNSLDRSEILVMALNELSLEVPRSEMIRRVSIGELAELFHEKLAAY